MAQIPAQIHLITRIILLFLYSGLLLLVAPLSFWMLFNAQTWVGYGLAVTGLVVILLPPLLARHYQHRQYQKIWGQAALFLALFVVAFLIVVITAAPSGSPGPDSPVQHRFLGDTNFGRFSLTNIIPESEQVVDIDSERLYLAGLSNGGLGVSRIAAEYPQTFQGLIFLSPVFDTGIVDSESFREMWAGRPILVISGEADKRIPIGYVQDRVAGMQSGDIIVTTAYYPNEDHFLTFSQPESITADVANWLAEGE